MITNQLDDLHASVNDIYTQWDEGGIDYDEAQQILMRVCKNFLAPQPDQNQDLNHTIYFERADTLWEWLEENQLTDPVTLTIHLGAKV
jgi:hypothetical protein